VAKEGYVFDRWIIKDSSTGYTRLITTNPLHEELATYDVFEACFAPTAYADVCKPTFSRTGNTYVVMSATISEGEGVEDTVISGIGSNLKKADEVQSDIQNTPSQWGATNVVMAQAGATFNLNIEYMPNWADVELFINNSVNNNGGEFVTLYGPYEGGNSAKEALNNMKADNRLGSSADNNSISFPVTLDNNLQGGDVVIIRTATGSLNNNACGSASQGGYLDFVFIIEKTAEPRTVKAVSAPIEGGVVAIDGDAATSVETIAPVTLSATANSGYRFVNWTGESREFVTSDAEFVYSGDTDTTFVANFVKVWTVTATSNNEVLGSVEIKGANEFGTIDHAAEIELIATSTPSGKFLHWTLDGNPLTSQNPFKTTILKNEVYQAVFEADYPVMKLQYVNGVNTDNENRSNRYLAKVTATAGNLETIVFEAIHEEGLPRVDAEASAYNYNVGEDGEVVPTTSGALIDKTGNTIKVKQGTTSISLNFVAWNENMTVRFHTAEPELDQTEQAIFIDWDNNKLFSEDECYGIVKSSADASFEAADGFNREITIPENIECGTYRMRVIYYDDLGIDLDWASIIFDEGIINMGRAYDFAIKVVEDENIITFDAPGESVFYIGDKADVTITYKDGMDIYYTTTGIDPDETSPVIKSGETIAINTISEGQVYLKAKAYDTEKGDYTPVFIAVYNVVQKNLFEDLDITLVDDVTTIVGASISSAYGKAKEGAIDFDFTQSKKDEVGPIYVEEGATFNLDIDVLLKKYGMRVIAYVKEKSSDGIFRLMKDGYLGSTSESIDAVAFETSLKNKPYSYSNDGTRYSISYPIETDYGVGSTVIYRFITSNKDYDDAPYSNSNQGEGEYVDFVFVVQPQSSVAKIAGTAAKDLKISVTTTDACYLSVGGYSRNLAEAATIEVPASLNGAGEMEIQAVGASISNMDIEVLEIGTNVLLPNVDYIGEVTLKSDADFNATTISHASQLPEDGIRVVVEKEITVPYKIGDKTPTYFNFISMPFDI
ncbi:MAG: hypothetical protein IKY54_06585, partial [Muribaculaceae bacterium]|nr:hypothetical protein [Muribaculaceae bacterium]